MSMSDVKRGVAMGDPAAVVHLEREHFDDLMDELYEWEEKNTRVKLDKSIKEKLVDAYLHVDKLVEDWKMWEKYSPTEKRLARQEARKVVSEIIFQKKKVRDIMVTLGIVKEKPNRPSKSLHGFQLWNAKGRYGVWPYESGDSVEK